MENLTEMRNLCYASYLGQSKALRKLAIERLGSEKVAMMSNSDIEDWLRKEGYVPMVVCIDSGSCNSETIYLLKEDTLNSDEILKICR